MALLCACVLSLSRHATSPQLGQRLSDGSSAAHLYGCLLLQLLLVKQQLLLLLLLVVLLGVERRCRRLVALLLVMLLGSIVDALILRPETGGAAAG